MIRPETTGETAVAAAPAIGLCYGTVHQANLVEMIEVAARRGFPTLQVPPDLYFAGRDQGISAAALRRRLSDAGVRVQLIDAVTAGIPGMSIEPVQFRGRAMPRWDAAACLEVNEALEAPLLNISHYLGEPVPLPEMAEAVGAVSRMAARRGVTLVLEFVPDSGIRTIHEAQEIAAACGEANCKIHLDTWHLARGGHGPAEVAALPPGAIGAFQLSDRIAPPAGTAYVPMTGRLLPGEGELPLADIVGAALANSPGITIEVEVFSEELSAMTADAAAARTAAAVEAWRERFHTTLR
jgi:sugar phosphate isomerase/epimerase